jgi:N-carbamoyl-L-amino-acid hydrolase
MKGIDQDRLWGRLMQSAAIGKVGETGLGRLALSDEDLAIRQIFIKEAERLGCIVRLDPFGNIFARWPGRRDDLPPIGIGSHLDTQPTGGRFDGILGVLAGLELVETLADRGMRPEHPIEIINWTNEEGSRFAPAMLGSGGFAGVFPADYVHSRTDRQGCRFDEELDRLGLRGSAEPHEMAGYFELHIEQGPVLEAAGLEIGVVTGVQAIQWFDAEIVGDCCHAGTTPMALRKDPVPALASLLQAVQAIGNSAPGLSLSTVGIIEASPGSRNTVPQSISLSIDLRHQQDGALAAMERDLLAAGDRIAAQHRVSCQISSRWKSPAVAFDRVMLDGIRSAADRLGLSQSDIVSGAGHDAVYVARVAPTAMIFVPCEDGISHNPRESITPLQAANGANVLLHAVIDFDRARGAV